MVHGVAESIITLVRDVCRYRGLSADVDLLRIEVFVLAPALALRVEDVKKLQSTLVERDAEILEFRTSVNGCQDAVGACVQRRSSFCACGRDRGESHDNSGECSGDGGECSGDFPWRLI